MANDNLPIVRPPGALDLKETAEALTTREAQRNQARSPAVLARAQVSRHLSRRLPYYLTPEEAHLLIDVAENERDRPLLRLLW